MLRKVTANGSVACSRTMIQDKFYKKKTIYKLNLTHSNTRQCKSCYKRLLCEVVGFKTLNFMRTLLRNYDCILEHDFIAKKQVKDGEIVEHNNTVERVIFYKQRYDNNGFEIGSEKIVIEKHFLSELLKTITEIQEEKKDMEYSSAF